MTNEPPADRPLVAVATLLEKVLHDVDGTLSAIRMVDTFRIPRVPNRSGPVILPVQALIAFKSGAFVGAIEVRFRVRRPSGSLTLLPDSYPVKFEGGHKGVNFSLGFLLKADERGLHYFEAISGETVLAAVPFTLVDVPDERQVATAIRSEPNSL